MRGTAPAARAEAEAAEAAAAAMLIPSRGGGVQPLRMGPVGEALGNRSFFETDEGEMGASTLSRTLDKIRELSVAIMTRRGETDPSESPEAQAEAAEMGQDAINIIASSIFFNALPLLYSDLSKSVTNTPSAISSTPPALIILLSVSVETRVVLSLSKLGKLSFG